MFKLKQKTKTASLSLALAAAMTGGVMMGTSTSVQAVNIANDGIGEVLIFPYYTARGGWNTYINLTNTSGRTLSVKIRWHEGVNSRDARDFNITMSPYDVWTGAVIPSAIPDGKPRAGEVVAKVITTDKTCVSPALPPHNAARGQMGVNFTNLAFAGKNADGGSESNERTMEGYFTVYVMGVAKKENNDATDPERKILTISEAAKHVLKDDNGNEITDGVVINNKGIPRNCGFIDKEFIKKAKRKDSLVDSAIGYLVEGPNDGGLMGEFHEPNNMIKGRAVLINAASGIAMGYDPTVLANFYNPTSVGSYAGLDSDGFRNIIEEPSSQRPYFDQADPAIAAWVDDTPGIHGNSDGNNFNAAIRNVSASEATASYGIGFGRAVDAVSLLFQRTAIVNDYNVAGLSKTDWVVTLPTKRWYVDNDDSIQFAAIPNDINAPHQPFDKPSVNGEAFNETLRGESCFDVSMRIWDREEGEVTDPDALNFSPKPPTGEANTFCYETNIVTFGKAVETFVDDVTGEDKPVSLTMGSHLTRAFSGLAGDYGWAQLEFGQFGNQSLPVVGMRLETRAKESQPGASYGFANAHSYKRPHLDEFGSSDAYSEQPAWEIESDRTEPQY